MSEAHTSSNRAKLPPVTGFPYSPAPMVNHFPGNAEDCFALVNQYGTYEIQRTADTGNFFPAIAQGLPKGAHFELGAADLEKTEKE